MNTFKPDILCNEGNRLDLGEETITYRNSWQVLVIASRIASDEELDDESKYKGICELLVGKPRSLDYSLKVTTAYLDRYFPQSKGHKVLDFDKDADLIYSAFYQAYGINLHGSDLTAGEFLMLLRGLPSDCRLSEVVGIRTMEIPKDREQAKRVRKAKQAVSLDDSDGFDGFARAVENMAGKQ